MHSLIKPAAEAIELVAPVVAGEFEWLITEVVPELARNLWHRCRLGDSLAHCIQFVVNLGNAAVSLPLFAVRPCRVSPLTLPPHAALRPGQRAHDSNLSGG